MTNASDGHIILQTQVDTSGIAKGTANIKSALGSVGNFVGQMGAKIQQAFSSFANKRETIKLLTQAIKDQEHVIKSLNLEYAQLVARGKQNSSQAKELKSRIDELTKELEELRAVSNSVGKTSMLGNLGKTLLTLGSYLIGIQTVFKFINFSKEGAQAASEHEASVIRLMDIYGEASDVIGDFIDENARALGMSKSAAASFSSVYGNLFNVWADNELNAKLTTKYLNATAVVASKTGRTVEDVQERIRSGLLGNTEAIEDLGIFVNVKTIEMTDAFQRMANGKSWEKLDAYTQQQIRTMAILEQATAKYGTEVSETSTIVRARYKAAYEDMKVTWGQFVNVVLIPVLKVVTKIMDTITAGMRQIAGLTGKTIDNSSNASNSLKDATKNQDELTDSIKKTNKEQKKSLANFDEIRTLSENKDDTSAEGSVEGNNSLIDAMIPDVGESDIDERVEKIEAVFTALLIVIGGALIVIGTFLLFAGQIGWGIGFIIAGAGAMEVGIASISELDISEKMKEDLHAIMAIVSGFMLAVGIILLFFGQWAWGIGFILVGAVGLVTEVAMNSDEIVNSLQGWVGGILAIVSTALLALGIILVSCGIINPLTIGMIVVGAVGLVTEVALNAGAIGETIKSFFEENAGLIVSLSSALIVIGVILIMCSMIPLGIGMIVAGTAGIVAEIAMNWGAITTAIASFFEENAGLVVGMSTAFIVLGVLLIMTGAGLGLGIGMLVVGITGLVAEVVLNWSAITDAISNFFEQNAGLIVGVSSALLVLGVILILTGVGIPLGLGMIVAGVAGIVAEVALNWNTITTFIQTNLATITAIISGFALAIGVILLLCGNIPLGVGLIVAGIGGLGFAAYKSSESKIDGSEVGNQIASELDKINDKASSGVNKVNKTLSGIQFYESPDYVNTVFSNNSNNGSYATSWSIPKLARGAVIPPNKEFLAVLGDQKSGTNIEAPLDTIKQAFRDELKNMGGTSETVTNINFTGNLAQLARILKPQIERETLRQGTKLITGGAY